MLKKSLSLVPEIRNCLEKFTSHNIQKIRENLFDFNDIVDLLEKSIVDKNDSERNKKDCDIIKYGFNKQLDEYIDISKNAKDYIAKEVLANK